MSRARMAVSMAAYSLAASCFLFASPSAAQTIPVYDCTAGGPGAIECSITNGDGTFHCHVTCAPSKFACCSLDDYECSCK
jgi:hypothetical protein